MNARRSGLVHFVLTVAVLAFTTTVAVLIALAHQVPAPIGFWPLTISGWITLVGSLAGAGVVVYFIFGPFLKERLRVFLGEKDTERLLHEKVCDILESADGGRLVRDVVTKQFAERFLHTARMREELSEAMMNVEMHEELLRRNGESLREIAAALMALARIEEQGKFVRQQVRRVTRILEARGSQVDSLMGEMSKAALGRREHPRAGRRPGPRPPTWMQEVDREFVDAYGAVSEMEMIDAGGGEGDDDPDAEEDASELGNPEYPGADQ